MISFVRTIVCFALIGFVGIQFAPLLDDPQHLVEPDPNCPICLAYKTEFCTNPHTSISFKPIIIHYLIEKVPSEPEKVNYSSILSIRAPPYTLACF